MTHTTALLAPSAKVSSRYRARSQSSIARVGAAGTFAAGGLLALVHSLAGSVGIAVVASVVAGALAGMLLARPELGYTAGAALAALAAFSGGFAFVGVVALGYAIVVGYSLAHRTAARTIDLTATVAV